MRYKQLILWINLAILGACGDSSKSQLHIVQGEIASEAERAALGVVALRVFVDEDPRGVCTGTLIDRQHILSAAHCLKTPKGAVKYAVFSTEMLQAQAEEIIEIEASYRPSADDIVVLKLKVQAPTTSSAIKLRNLTQRPREAIAYGYGRSDSSNSLSSGILRKKAMNLSFWEKSAAIVTAVPLDSKGGPCYGDSGGPLFGRENSSSSWAILGVLSNGNPDCRGGDTWTQAPRWIPLIEKAIADPSLFKAI